jgi:hypothetical protein
MLQHILCWLRSTGYVDIIMDGQLVSFLKLLYHGHVTLIGSTMKHMAYTNITDIFYVHVTVHRNKFLYNKAKLMHQFQKFIVDMKLHMFRTVPLSIIRSLFTVHSAMVYVIQVSRQLSSRSI